MTDTHSPIPDLTPADIIEVADTVRRMADVFGEDTARAAAVVVLMDRHGFTREEAAQRVTLATRALRAARAQVAAARFSKNDLTRLAPPGALVVTVDPDPTVGQTSGRTPHVVIIDEVRHIDAA